MVKLNLKQFGFLLLSFTKQTKHNRQTNANTPPLLEVNQLLVWHQARKSDQPKRKLMKIL